MTGTGFDRDTLIEAGIEEAGAFAAVSSGDNSNILAARVARETFGVENVVARIYDPRRAEIYQRLGIPTVATVRWTADQMLRRLLPGGAEEHWRDPSGTVLLAEVHLSPNWVGQRVSRPRTSPECPSAPARRQGTEFCRQPDRAAGRRSGRRRNGSPCSSIAVNTAATPATVCSSEYRKSVGGTHPTALGSDRGVGA